jgi:hypothetical protein
MICIRLKAKEYLTVTANIEIKRWNSYKLKHQEIYKLRKLLVIVDQKEAPPEQARLGSNPYLTLNTPGSNLACCGTETGNDYQKETFCSTVPWTHSVLQGRPAGGWGGDRTHDSRLTLKSGCETNPFSPASTTWPYNKFRCHCNQRPISNKFPALPSTGYHCSSGGWQGTVVDTATLGRPSRQPHAFHEWPNVSDSLYQLQASIMSTDSFCRAFWT